MKQKITLLLTVTMALGMTSLSAFAQGRRGDSIVNQCMTLKREIDSEVNEDNRLKKIEQSAPMRMDCENHLLASQYLGSSIDSGADARATKDKRIVCQKVGGWTADYRSCIEALKVYDTILLAEQGMFAYQKVEMDASIQRSEKEVSQRAATGDLQGAAIDAQNKHIRKMKDLNIQQRNAYGAAVTGLGVTLGKWQGDSEKSFSKLCANQGSSVAEGGLSFLYPDAGEHRADCQTVFKSLHASKRDQLIANTQAKSAFVMALTEYIGKAVKAGISAGQFDEISKQLDLQKPRFEETTAEFDYCAANPLDRSCLGPGTRVERSMLGGHEELTFDHGNVNSFNDNGGSQTFGEEGLATNIKDQNIVEDIGSPFEQDAKIASGILDPAGAASAATGGGDGAAMGGGGGGGMGGGGSASLGNDLAGAEDSSTKEGEIKANQVSGSYSSTGSTKGFSAVKPMKENSNPFASLFDGSGGGSGGGVVEDRTIASGADIDGAASGLFQKISKRYGKVHADKRIESKNLE